MKNKVFKLGLLFVSVVTSFFAYGTNKTIDAKNLVNENEKIEIENSENTENTEAIENEDSFIPVTEIRFSQNLETIDEDDFVGPYKIKVNRKENVITIYSLDEENQETPIKTMLCSVGLGANNETPLGTFKTIEQYKWREMLGGVYAQYATRFNGNILFHSVRCFYKNNGTLNTKEYNKLGSPASHGCVRLSVADAKWIYDNCDNGTVVEVYESDEPSPLGKPLGIKIDETSEYKGWDPTDPNENNPWIGKLPKIENVQNVEILVGSNEELLNTVLNEVSGLDYDGSKLDVFIDNIDEIDLNTTGTYEIIYGTTGEYGATVFEKASVDVVESIE